MLHPSRAPSPARAPFLGSHAIAIAPTGVQRLRRVVAQRRDRDLPPQRRTGQLTQSAGTAGCIAAGRRRRLRACVGLHGPNSVAVSPDGRNVYATSVKSNAVTVLRRNP